MHTASNKTWLASVAAGLLLAGCTGGSEASGPAPSGNNRPTADAAAGEQGQETTEPDEPEISPTVEETTPEPPGNPEFGESYTWEDGLSVTIGEPSEFTPSEFAAFDDAESYVAFTVTIVNNTGANYDPTFFSTTLQSANVEADEVFDSENGFDGSPSTPLLDGREAEFKIGYGVADPSDLVMQVAPDFTEYEPAIYVSAP